MTPDATGRSTPPGTAVSGATASRGTPGTKRGEADTRLDHVELCEEAMRLTGLDDFGSPDYRSALAHLTASLGSQARLNPYGRAEARTVLLDALCTRLRLHANALPALDPAFGRGPVVLVGLPRTGSTLLHHLLAHHPSLRAPRLWELLAPLTPPGTTEDLLVGIARRHVTEHFRAAPDLRRIHPTSATGPEECEYLMNTDFRNAVLATISYRLPDYAAWLMDQDLTGAYRLHQAQLRHILARRPAPAGARLLLKSPSHIWHLPSLAAVYPRADLVVLHRDTDAAIGSVCGLALAARRKRSDDVDAHEIGRQMTAATHTALDRLRAFTAQPPPGIRCLAVTFDELTRNPRATAERVSDWLGVPVTESVRRGWRDHLSRHPRPPHEHPRGPCGLPSADGRPTS
ncbi:sulfotransferase family protein [Streptomyces sp. NPDC059134]|uniref:sulfotransferase family protein n=1 Tax=Streptomyces sp. NPDC059134 TaxID=3346738 RepID=UPI0036C949A7